ncbi:hypothetical protein [Paenibacillus flagellatus]|uniref:DUF2269 domain-containing protein n=1 Tax=Paenibacillus flagellatus TaxID=2211139 RepID=A0A2V5KTE2_9BACL|nr:hypothetical protein [Paenibacillus flagellatus]PYI52456.1 hypothetical protein DLM86_19945 [Paenibacillus flagellatus]
MGYKLSIKKKQAIVILHVLAVVCWLGGAMVMLLLGTHMLKAENGEQLYYTLDNMHLIDVVFIRYTALAALLTGIILSVWTNWGLFKHYWILTKLILTLMLIGFGIEFMGDWLSQIVRIAKQERFLALSDTAFRNASYSLIGGAIANIVSLIFMTALSYFKPFGKIKAKVRKSKPQASG